MCLAYEYFISIFLYTNQDLIFAIKTLLLDDMCSIELNSVICVEALSKPFLDGVYYIYTSDGMVHKLGHFNVEKASQ